LKIFELKKTLGYLGFIPFCTLTISPWIFGGDIAENSILLLILYSSIILSFLGGISWGWSDSTHSQKLNLIYGISFSLFSFLILISAFLNSLLPIILSFIGFNGFYFFETRRNILFNQNKDYKELRKNLTVLVSICFLVTIAYIVNPYS